ncbi:DNA repair ATPase [Virgisporangium ochraceum]|uniref:AAA family ATPase n=1 Tax=Virgisporangium ochraceum TaxID=65505 RepID=A0A8J4ECV8_9ACTN|nr:DNA repair ATPase [Virgisporangium ochraceum]GIJ70885.1 hypothetical protein Voc01_058020 [Virgisporangium ochraceum]
MTGGTSTTVGPDTGAYAVLRARLARHGRDLAKAAEKLDAQRATTFASTALRVLGLERVRTPAPTVARDVVWVGGRLVVGFEGTLAAYTFHREGETFHLTPSGAAWLRDERLHADLAELFRYHRHTRLLRLRVFDDRLLATFQVGPRPTDIRVLRWAVAADGSVSYVDNQGERERAAPPPADVGWTPAGREDQVLVDRRPVLLVDGAIHVSTTGGALTVTPADDRDPVFSEPVDEPLQSLADADVAYARVGALVLLRVRPYREESDRYLAYNTHTREVVRLDGLGRAVRRLPDDRGVVFPGGYCLSAGPARGFDVDDEGMEFERVVRPAGGADLLYVFHARTTGRSLLVPYDVVRDEVVAPIEGTGHALTDDGILLVLKDSGAEPTRTHTVQAWHTPYVDEAAGPAGEGPLARIGNADLVRAVSDCLALARSARDVPESTAAIEALAAAGNRLLDRHHWLGDAALAEAGVGDLRTPVAAVRDAAVRLLDEYERTRVAVAASRAAEDEAAEQVTALVRRAEGERPDSTAGWVGRLAELRAAHGLLAGVRERPHVRPQRIDDLAAALDAATADAGRRAVEFLAAPDAFAPYHARLDGLDAAAREVATGADADAFAERLTAEVDALRAVTDVVGTLDAADTGQRARILEQVGTVLGGLNRTRATLDARVREVRSAESRAAFAAESTLLQQSVTAALALADTPRRCDAEVASLLVRLEDLEARFGSNDWFVAGGGDEEDQQATLAATRAAVTDAFAARKQALLDERARRVDRVAASCERVFAAIAHRSAALSTVEEVRAYFAGDPLVGRLRALAEELRGLDEPVRAVDVAARLVAARQDANRTVRDRADLYDDGGATIRLGAHRFAVTTEPVEVAVLPHGDDLAVTVTGTGYRRPVRDDGLATTRRFWDRPVVSESPTVYRGEYLAASLLPACGPGTDLAALVREAAAARHDEGYVTGVHDHDATAILGALVDARAAAGLLRYPPDARAAAQLYWGLADPDPRLAHRAAALVRARDTVGAVEAVRAFADDLRVAAHRFLADAGLPTGGDLVGEYLVEELATGPSFVASVEALDLLERFRADHGDVVDPDDGPGARHQIASAWLTGLGPFVPEAVAMLVCDVERVRVDAPVVSTVEGLLGAHPRVVDGRLEFRLDDLLARTREHEVHEVPAYRAYRSARAELVERERDRLRIDEHRPAVPDSFVRNRLIDEVYLPLIGDNLARQLGTTDPAGATERSGLLVLVSPPGYGKTTLVEYVASRLGLLLVTVNGPALGTGTTSLDPDGAPDAAARQEVEKINLALELGTNVMLYIDDIQHTSPELLQRFVPLCDAGRRIESVRDGRAVTVDLRGTRFAVCLAGNPYTSAGQRFRLPDMLANRADVLDLGEVLSGRDDLFEESYLENARAALSTEDTSALLTHVRDVMLAVNRAYIDSAAQTDASRTEPPFLLQGSYRDMNAIARRVHPTMDTADVDALVDDHYAGEARTLGPHAEANLLKLALLRGGHTPAQAERWDHVTAAYRRQQLLGGSDDDPVARAVGAITTLTDRLEAAILRAAAVPPPNGHRIYLESLGSP